MFFDVRVDLRRKARLVIGGHVINSSRHDVYVSTMKYFSDRILMTIAVANNLDLMTGDIVNAYLNANTEEKIYSCAGAEFKVLGIISEGNLLKFIKAVYGLPTSRKWVLSRTVLTWMSEIGGTREATIILELTPMMS